MFQRGISVDQVAFVDDSRELRQIWYTAAHDEESNKFKVSSLANKMEVISIAMKKCGAEASARAELLQALGSGAKSRVNKWLRAFRNLQPEVKQALHGYDRVPQTYIWDNVYLMGEGTKSKQRLGPTAALQSLALIQKDAWQQSIAVQHFMAAQVNQVARIGRR